MRLDFASFVSRINRRIGSLEFITMGTFKNAGKKYETVMNYDEKVGEGDGS